MINKLKLINEKLIYKNKNNNMELKKQLLIKEILNEKNCFLKMNIEKAYSVLRDLEIDEKDLKEIYLKLI